ncbi:MAG: enoyl-CoA hydratase family protein [Micromonosporaceae bacterium]
MTDQETPERPSGEVPLAPPGLGGPPAPPSGKLVRFTIADGIATITLDSPRNRNALSRQLVSELAERLDAAADDPSVRAVLLTHTSTVFCAGADLSEARQGGMNQGAGALLDLLRQIVQLPKPVIARIDGAVRAGGLGLVGAADIAVASESSGFAFTEARLGLTPAIISLTVLPRLDPRAASRYFLTGEKFDGATAARIGLVTAAAPDVDTALEPILAGVRAGSPQGLAESKKLVAAGVLAAIDQGGDQMAELSARLFGSEEAAEGMSSFLERRPPRWASGSS